MFEWSWPWIFLLLPLPLLIRARFRSSESALRGPLFEQWLAMSGQSGLVEQRWQRLQSTWPLWLLWCLLLMAAARPTWVGPAQTLPYSGRDLMVAVDLSGSMRIEDMQRGNTLETRMEVVRRVVTDFVERRRGDRLGLILFGTQSYLQAPLTFDVDTVARFMQEAQIGFAGPETAIVDAIGLAVKQLRDRPAESRVLVLLTDGQDNASAVPPLAAADIAASFGIRIHTIGVGSDQLRVSGLFGTRTVDPSADLDEETLRMIAERTGGQYFRARDPAELEQIYAVMDALEPMEQEAGSFRPQLSLLHWPLAFALALWFVLVLRSRWLSYRVRGST